MAESPNKDREKPLRFTIYSEGSKIKDSFGVITIYVYRAVNQVGLCMLTLDAGSMPQGEIPESDDDTFAPGKNIRVEAGYGDSENILFEGFVTAHNLWILEGNKCTLCIECSEYTFPLTLGRKNRVFEKSKDSDAIKKIIGEYAGLQATISETSTKYNELVQYYCTDWDFIRSRMDMNGLVLVADGKKISIKEPNVSASPAVKVTYGTDLIEFKGELQTVYQQSKNEAVGWDISKQELFKVAGSKPSLNNQGDATPATLAKAAKSDKWTYQTELCQDKTSLKSWVDAQLQKTGLARIQGTVKFYGNTKVLPGGLIELNGFGKRFNGAGYIGTVEHEIREGDWVTIAGMGLPIEDSAERNNVNAPVASGLLPGIQGLHIGKVTKLDSDPTKEQRIQVEIPVLNSDNNKVWARLAGFWSGKNMGAFFIPDVGDEVVLGFFNNDPCHAVILGSMFSSKLAPPYQLTKENNTRAIITREKMKIVFDEEKKVISIETPGNNKIEISDNSKGIVLTDQNKNKLEMNNSGITLDSAKNINIKAKGNIVIDAGANLEMKSKSKLTSEGMTVETKAKVSLKLQGTASAELSASGQTTVKGAMVMIN